MRLTGILLLFSLAYPLALAGAPAVDHTPVLRCPVENVVQAHDLALQVVQGNIKPWKRGLLSEAKPALMAGAGYGSPWTRDASYNTFFGAGLLFSDVARDTLLSVLLRDEGTGRVRIGGQYWDCISWVTGAWALYTFTGDREFLQLAYEATVNSIEHFVRTEFDEATGLFCGPGWSDGVAGYPKPYNQAGGSSFILDFARHNKDVDKIRMKALSTNCLYANAYRLAARMARVLAKPRETIARFESKERALKGAINAYLWQKQKGHYAYFLDRGGRADTSMEALGHAHAILFSVASPEQTDRLFTTQYVSPHGVPCIWPLFPRFSRDAPGRHCGTVWPQIQGFWALAAASHGRVGILRHEFESLTNCALLSGDFREIYHPFTGKPYGGVQVGRVWRSEHRQTWAATAYLAMIYRGIFGMQFEPNGIAFHPNLPAPLGRIELRSLRYRRMTLRVKLTGSGTRIESFALDGKTRANPWLPATLTGAHEINIQVRPRG